MACRHGNPLANVYHPGRLKVIAACKTVEGTVALVRHEQDADLHIDLRLDPAMASLANSVNMAEQHGDLVLEIVPADQVGCPFPAPRPGYDYGTCSHTNEQIPAVGDHVSVTGPYVLDENHGWMEIHPVWQWTIIGAAPVGAASLPARAAPSSAAAAPATVAPISGHTFYASGYRTARTIYCDDDPAWRKLSPRYLDHYPTLQEAEAAHPGYTLHRPC
ncbi:MAG: hypothetical protein ACYDAG_18415 [Chloroflexota bacterium]